MKSLVTPDINPLAELLKAKNREAFSTLYDQYSATLFNIIGKIVRNTKASEELLQDIFIKVWKNIDRYDASKGTLFTWMLNITRNTCIDYLRSSRHKRELNSHPLDEGETTLTAGCNMPYTPENSELRGWALKLDHKYRQIIDLIYFWGYTQEDVSKILNIPLGTVKTRSRNGLQQLRILYKNMYND